MSTMQATHGHSEACCNIPPVVSKGYKTKGSYEQVGGWNTYVTGPRDARKAIVAVFDIFGFFEQTLQGADILANGDGGDRQYQVYMPDWFEGKPCPIEIYPPDTPDKKKKLADFFEANSPQRIASLVPALVDAVRAHNPAIEKLAIVGYCWGAKVALLSSTPSTPSTPAPSSANPPAATSQTTPSLTSPAPFGATALLHPAMLSPLDARPLTKPVVLLASRDEPRQAVTDFDMNIPRHVPRHIEIFGDQIHGWMAARADLEKDRVREEYERGYCVLIEFLGKHF
ncbi:putative AIM2 family protein [Escovopsis weberi]|uniref:Putative AIM2 family protein n=1 Tax=Escovopsis weberi TaxID=150374 RepID=A0A0M8N0Z0_ESCWE|nr:putative AIM2 family protein [Escovopsis weberi]